MRLERHGGSGAGGALWLDWSCPAQVVVAQLLLLILGVEPPRAGDFNPLSPTPVVRRAQTRCSTFEPARPGHIGGATLLLVVLCAHEFAASRTSRQAVESSSSSPPDQSLATIPRTTVAVAHSVRESTTNELSLGLLTDIVIPNSGKALRRIALGQNSAPTRPPQGSVWPKPLPTANT